MQRRCSCASPLMATLASVFILGAAAHAQYRPGDADAPGMPNSNPANWTLATSTAAYAPPAGAYYVSAFSQRDMPSTNPNTPSTPKAAVDGAPEGATIVFLEGTYRNVDSIGIRKQLTLQAERGAQVWIKGSLDLSNGWTRGTVPGSTRPYWRRAWSHDFGHKGDSRQIRDYALAGERNMVFVNHRPLVQVGSLSAVGGGKFFADYSDNNNASDDFLYIGDDPALAANRPVEVTQHHAAFNSWARNVAGGVAQGTVIRGLGFMHFANEAILVGSADMTLEDNVFVWNAVAGARVTGYTAPDGEIAGDANNAHFRRNLFSCNGEQGLAVGNVSGVVVENNTFSYNNAEDFNRAWSAAGVKAIQCRETNAAPWNGLIIRGNLVHHNFSTGLWMDVNCIGYRIYNNTVFSNKAIGIFGAELCHRAIVAFNTVYDNGTGIMVADATRARVWNNTLFSNNTALVVKDGDRVNDGRDEDGNLDPDLQVSLASGSTWITADIEVQNNLFSNGRKTDGYFLDATPTYDRGSAALFADGSSLDHNLYHRPGYNFPTVTSPEFAIRWDPSTAPNNDASFRYPADFRNATGQRFEPNGFGSIVSNSAMFVNAANNNFSLAANSPARNAGTRLPQWLADLVDRPGLGDAQGTTRINVGAK